MQEIAETLPGALGRSLPAAPLAAAAVAALQPGTDRRAVVEDAVVEPELTTEEAQALGVKEIAMPATPERVWRAANAQAL